jgi:hypothetical protein
MKVWVSLLFLAFVMKLFSEVPTMGIIISRDDKILSDKGSLHGIVEHTVFDIVRDTQSGQINIGEATVVATRPDKSGLRILKINGNFKVRDTDKLIQKITEADEIFAEMDKPQISSEIESKVESLEGDLKEYKQDQKVKGAKNEGLLTGVAVCCGIVVILNLLAASAN